MPASSVGVRVWSNDFSPLQRYEKRLEGEGGGWRGMMDDGYGVRKGRGGTKIDWKFGGEKFAVGMGFGDF